MFIPLSDSSRNHPAPGRYRMMYHEEQDAATKSLMISHGIDPDTMFVLAQTFDHELEAFMEMALTTMTNPLPNRHYVLVDSMETLEVVS